MLYLVGDLQGCDDALERLLSLIDFSPSRARLVVLGDLVNRGPGSLAVLRRLRGFGDAATCLLGNHDLHLLAVACGGRKAHRSDTFAEVLESPERAHWLAWLRGQRMAVVEEGWLCVHAGVVPQWDLAETLARAAEVEAMLRSEALDFATPPAGTDLCWDGAQPAPADPDAPGRARCRAAVVFPETGMSMADMALRASALVDWALAEQAKRLARADWDADCRTAREGTDNAR